ncbi:biotin transporter BioY [Alicyclobacillus tolerans]|uniref:Biotin transporter n=2 Tax=Alicyclobacillus tolerans TaxID=90970 RepID=A0A1M6M0R6_9BACL|nr:MULTISPECIES: biotin transporter BioY [Alicyclobacillus]MDP9728607.1 biotin transport system substrate-specific component [Alicyclobacillus tengchongensis]QRF22601.1 biotin transporter BioY [Alicyclobacillus sp. TC]SHJ76903.1 biotin transport system substrate-specific component [Alicyclobacillus montanus]
MRITVRGIIFSALFAALLAVLSFVSFKLPFTPVPITLENLMVMLAGALLGGGYGFLSMLLVVVLVALGVPMLDGSGGIGVLVGPSGGYVWMYPICALLAGYLIRRVRGNGPVSFVWIAIIAFVFGDLLCYVTGVGWLAHLYHLSLSKALVLAAYPYLPGDAAKAVITALITVQVRRVFPVERLVGSSKVKLASPEVSA